MFNKLIKSIFYKAGLKEAGFKVKDKLIFQCPISDFLKGFYFDKVGDHFYVGWFITPLYQPLKFLPITYGNRLCPEPGRDMFVWEKDSDNSNIIETLVSLIDEAKKILLTINTPLDFYNEFKDFDKTNKTVDIFRHKETLAYTLCYLNSKDCQSAVNEVFEYHKSITNTSSWMQTSLNNLEKLYLASSNSQNIERLFQEWKIFSFENLRLNKYCNKVSVS